MAKAKTFTFSCRFKDSTGKMHNEIIEKRGLKSGGKVQQIIDSEVLRMMDKYVPFENGALKNNGIICTEIGSGEIVYTLPYARRQYYIPMNHEGIRCAYWFEQMKNDGGKEKLLNIAKKAAGAK